MRRLRLINAIMRAFCQHFLTWIAYIGLKASYALCSDLGKKYQCLGWVENDKLMQTLGRPFDELRLLEDSLYDINPCWIRECT